MKNLKLVFFAIFLIANNCTSQTYIENALLNKIVEQQEFTFVAERVDITDNDISILKIYKPDSNVGRLEELNYGSGIVFKNKEIAANLPYFGTMYYQEKNRFKGRNSQKVGYNFIINDYIIKKKNGKNGKVILSIQSDELKRITEILLEISPTGRAYLSINYDSRLPKSYFGYIMKNEEDKENKLTGK